MESATPFAPPMIDVENLNLKEQVLHFSFNQDNTCIAIGTTRGFRIYQCFPFKLVSWGDIGAVRIVEMQYTTNILAIVGDGENHQISAKRLTIWDTKLNDGTLEISFSTKITKIRLNHELIYVAIKDKIFIFHLDGLRLIDKLEVDHLNRIVLSPSGEMNPYLVYSPSIKEGLMAVYNTNN
jgi:autophagy-related protein 18